MPTSSSSRHRYPVAALACGLAFAGATLAVTAQAGERRVIIGEVSSKVVRSGVDYESVLRAASEEELRTLDLSRVPRGKKVIVSVALVRLDTLAEVRATDASCVVSASLRDAKAGTVFAILEGRARAKSGDERGSVESAAVHGALHGALARIPEALGR
jgi:hypothetical protein